MHAPYKFAEYALLLKNSRYKGNANFDDVLKRARDSRGRDANGYRAEFIRLVERAELIKPSVRSRSFVSVDDDF